MAELGDGKANRLLACGMGDGALLAFLLLAVAVGLGLLLQGDLAAVAVEQDAERACEIAKLVTGIGVLQRDMDVAAGDLPGLADDIVDAAGEFPRDEPDGEAEQQRGGAVTSAAVHRMS